MFPVQAAGDNRNDNIYTLRNDVDDDDLIG